MNEVFIVVWAGGYEPPEYVVKTTEEEAFEQAIEWASALEEGIDTIDVLRLDLQTLTIDRLEDGE